MVGFLFSSISGSNPRITALSNPIVQASPTFFSPLEIVQNHRSIIRVLLHRETNKEDKFRCAIRPKTKGFVLEGSGLASINKLSGKFRHELRGEP